MLVSVEIVNGSKESVHKVSEKVNFGDTVILFLVRLSQVYVLFVHADS